MRKKNVFSTLSIVATILIVGSWISGGSSFVPVSEMDRLNGELNADGYCIAKLDLHPEFPLRYKDRRFAATPRKFCDPQPRDQDEVYEWLLRFNRKARLLTKKLWCDATPGNKENADLDDDTGEALGFLTVRKRHWGFWTR